MSTIYIADGQRTSRMVLERLVPMLELPVTVRSFPSAEHLLTTAQNESPPPSLVIVDPMTCGIEGEAYARVFRVVPGLGDVPLLFVLGAELLQQRARVLSAGVTDFLLKPVAAPEFVARCATMLRLSEQRQQLSDRTAWLKHKVDEATREIRSREVETLLRLARAGEFRDEETGLHVLRMSRYASLMASHMGLDDDECLLIERAAQLHDIGKIGVEDQILRKPGRLSGRERQALQRHPQIGYDILRGSPSKYLQAGARIALAHHECFDGSGYPGGLRGTEIPLHARIVTVADVYDALTTPRPYKQPWGIDAALDELRRQRGRQFDGDCVDAFLAVLDDVLKIQAALADDSAPRSEASP